MSQSNLGGATVWTTIHTAGQWQIQVGVSGEYRLVNIGSDGTLQYYQAQSGKYGEPILVAEPDLAVACPSQCRYIKRDGTETTPTEKVSGLICKDENGVVVLRVSLTNAKNKGISWSLADDGTLTVDGKTFHLYALVQKDKNRVRNYDAFFSAHPDHPVEVLELEDLI